MKLRCAFGVVVAAAFAAQAAAQGPVTIKIAEPKAGEKVRVTEEEVSTSTTLIPGQPAKEEKGTRTLVYVEECVTPPAESGKKSLKAIRTYEKIAGTKDGQPLDPSLVGKPITIEKKGDKYTFTAGGTAVTGPIAGILDQAYNKNDGPAAKEIIPTTPVKPGDNWKIDVKKALAGLADDKLQIDLDKAAMSGKLVKAYAKDGVGYGVLEMKASLPITGLGPKNPLTVKPGSSMTMTMTGDGCIDGTTATGDSTTKMAIKIDASVMGVDITVTADVTQKKTTAQLPKK